MNHTETSVAHHEGEKRPDIKTRLFIEPNPLHESKGAYELLVGSESFGIVSLEKFDTELYWYSDISFAKPDPISPSPAESSVTFHMLPLVYPSLKPDLSWNDQNREGITTLFEKNSGVDDDWLNCQLDTDDGLKEYERCMETLSENPDAMYSIQYRKKDGQGDYFYLSIEPSSKTGALGETWNLDIPKGFFITESFTSFLFENHSFEGIRNNREFVPPMTKKINELLLKNSLIEK